MKARSLFVLIMGIYALLGLGRRRMTGRNGAGRSETGSRRRPACWRSGRPTVPSFSGRRTRSATDTRLRRWWADRLYVISNKGPDDEFVQALAVEDAKVAWSTQIGKVGANKGPQYPGSRSTPTVDGDAVYVLGSDGDLACLDKKTGQPRWQKNLRSDFGGQPGNWAYSESPLIDGDVLVCTPGGAEATLVALDKKSGDVVWKSALPEADQAAYASIIVVEFGGVKQYVQFLQKGLVGVAAKSGKLLVALRQNGRGQPGEHSHAGRARWHDL